jgi:PBP1b-binding outer membrane lipoprotein LpoB
MSAINVQTREIVWQSEETIAKKKEKSWFGW